MDTTAKAPGNPGTTQDGRPAGGHIHQLLGLAASLVKAGSGTRGDELLSTAMGLDLSPLSDNEAAAWAQNLEHASRLLEGLKVHAAGEIAQRIAAGRYQENGSPKPVDFLSSSLKLSRAEAANRLRLAERFLSAMDPFSLISTPPSQPVLGAALFAGKISAEQALVVSGFIDQAAKLEKSGTVDTEDVSSLEATLAGHAEVEPPYFLRHLGIRALALLDPDGQKPSESDRLAKQGLSFHRPYKGWVRLDGYLTINQFEQAMACLDWATNPKRQNGRNACGEDANRDDSSCRDASGSTASDDASQGSPLQEDLVRLLVSFSTGGMAQPQTPPPPGPAPAAAATGTEPPPPATGTKPPPPDRRATFPVRSTSQGWRRPLAPDEIPPRPANAPPGATAPVYEGDSWFWMPDSSPEPVGWDPPTDDTPYSAAQFPDSFPATDATAQTTHPGGRGWPTPGHEPNADWWAGQVPSEEEADGSGGEPDTTEPWPHLVDGVWVPAPGSEDPIPWLNPIDPQSTDPAVKDGRTRAQMLLDGFLHCLKLAAANSSLPLNGGLKTQLYLSVTQEDLDRQARAEQSNDGMSRGGSLSTPYSGQVPLPLFSEELCDADVTRVLVDSNGGILDVGRTQRLFTFAQRKILVARDMGCAFPDCTMPPQWTEAHHIIPWQDGGDTSVDNGVLCCSRHHHYLHERGWTVRLIGGAAWFTPPYSEDITQRERRNFYHRG